MMKIPITVIQENMKTGPKPNAPDKSHTKSLIQKPPESKWIFSS